MPSRPARILAPLVALCLFATVAVGSVGAANPNRMYDFRACWDDGLTSGSTGVMGTQSWAAFRVTAVAFGFSRLQFGEFYSITPARSGSETSGWHAPQTDGGDFVGTLLAGNRVVATMAIREPEAGWSTLPAC